MTKDKADQYVRLPGATKFAPIQNTRVILSKACTYGIKAMICIAVNSNSGEKISLREVAHTIESPEAFTSKILQRLVREGLVLSTKGVSGGYSLKSDINDPLTLWDVVRVIDGEEIRTDCVLGIAQCSNESPCPVHFKYKGIREAIMELMKSTQIDEMSKNVVDGLSVLKT